MSNKVWELRRDVPGISSECFFPFIDISPFIDILRWDDSSPVDVSLAFKCFFCHKKFYLTLNSHAYLLKGSLILPDDYFYLKRLTFINSVPNVSLLFSNVELIKLKVKLGNTFCWNLLLLIEENARKYWNSSRFRRKKKRKWEKARQGKGKGKARQGKEREGKGRKNKSLRTNYDCKNFKSFLHA